MCDIVWKRGPYNVTMGRCDDFKKRAKFAVSSIFPLFEIQAMSISPQIFIFQFEEQFSKDSGSLFDFHPSLVTYDDSSEILMSRTLIAHRLRQIHDDSSLKFLTGRLQSVRVRSGH